MKKLIRYIKGYKKESIIAPAFKMLEATFELFVPLVMANIIDKGIINGDKKYILFQGVILLLLAAIGLTCSLIAQYFAAKAAVGFSSELRKDLFVHINKLSYTELDVIGTSTLITRMTSDINAVQNGVNLFLRLFLRSPFIVFGAMIMAFRINFKAALIFVVAIPLLAIVVFGIMLITMPMYKNVQKQLDKVMLRTRENVTGSRVIRAFNRQDEENNNYVKDNDLLKQLFVKVGNISALMNPVTYVIVNFSIILIVWQGGISVNTGVLTQGEVIALVNYMSQILVELVKLANLIVSITKAMSSASRVASVFDISSSLENKENAIKVFDNDALYAVEFDNVSFTYSGASSESLSSVSFKVKKGETIGVIGSTGCGKSSLINLIPRFYDVTGGSVKIAGVDVRDYDITALRDYVSVVSQKAVLFKGSIKDNLRWGNNDASNEDCMKALDISCASEFVEKKDGGVDFMLTQGGNNLSGGQKQRLSIARSLMKKSPILILDDSSSALDYATDAKLRAAIKNSTDSSTVFIVSQRASTVRNSDKIIVLDDGIMVGFGSHDELIDTCEVYKEICMSQVSGEEAE